MELKEGLWRDFRRSSAPGAGRDLETRADSSMPASRRSKHPFTQTGALPPEQVGSWFFVVCTPDHSSRMYPLQSGQTHTLGRDASADIVLDYPWVSNRHATIAGGALPQIIDLGSRNGTRVGGELLAPGKAMLLSPGMVISIGNIAILVHRGDARSSDSSVWPCAQKLVDEPIPTSPPRSSRRATQPGTATPVIICDPKMERLYDFVKQVAQSNVSVLILGETGTGKELLTRAVHENSPRSRGPLVTLNCAAIPENLFESELFGYERGAFSGAINAKPGLFEAAHGSTIFLDEIAELPASVQPKLLRVLEAGEVLRLGSVRPVHVDVRVVSATNRDLRAETAAGTFRADLFYRLNGITLSLPPLRERKSEILQLAVHFAAAMSKRPQPELTPAAIEMLREYPWPGNVRELRSVIERAALLAQADVIDVQHLLFESAAAADLPVRSEPYESGSYRIAPDNLPSAELPTETVLAELSRRERRHIEEALERTGGNQKDAAKLLGISRRTLIRRLERYRLARPRKRGDGPGDG